MVDIDGTQQNIFLITQWFLGLLSATTNIILIFAFILMNKKPLFTLELIFYLTIASLITNVSKLMLFIRKEDQGDHNNFNKLQCEVQAFLMILSEFSLVILANFITIHLYISVKYYYKEDVNDTLKGKCRSFIYIIGYGIPILLATFSQIFQQSGESGYWCWIKSEAQILTLVYYAFIWAFNISNFFFGYSAVHLNENLRISDTENKMDYIKKIARYTILCFLYWIPATIDRVCYYFTKQRYSILLWLHMIFFQMQGFMFGLLFFINNIEKTKVVVANLYKESVLKLKEMCCCCCATNKNDNSSANLLNKSDIYISDESNQSNIKENSYKVN